ncbi:basic salivary proline-rich protein 3-like [Eschrichtius robustus]|uniref:basic salivary proline-rich protein 3-like n=1 Tax=Eschrichtius robustus TaxID=9764 RepID=UPI0035C1D342
MGGEMACVPGLQGSESKTCASLSTGQVAPLLRDRASGGGGGHAPCLGLTQPSPGSTQRPRARPAEGRATSSPTFRLPKLSSRRATPPPRTPSPRAHRQESKEDGRSELGQARAPRPAPRMEPDPSCSRSAGPGTRDPEPTAPPRGRRSSHQAPTSPGADETRPRLPRREKWGTAVERGSRDPAWSNNRTRSAGRERVGEETGTRRKPQSRPPSPSWWNRPATASCPGSASQLQPQEKSETQGPDARPGIPRPGPAIPQLRTPPYPDAVLRSSLAAGTRPASAPAAGRSTRLLPPVGFKLKFPG